MVATDRISAFDYVLGSGIPDKGKVLTQLSAFWFERHAAHRAEPRARQPTSRAIPADLRRHADVLAGRSMLVRKTNPVPIECVARGYLSGSGWKDYVATGAVCGVALPAGLRESDRLPQPIFTPATKADERPRHQHQRSRGGRHRRRRPHRTLRVADAGALRAGAAHAERCGIILADTKFEFGLMPDGEVILIDEVMTPDSSRYWPQDQYEPGRRAAELRQAVRARLPRADPLEQAAAGAVAPGRGRGARRARSTSKRSAACRAGNSTDAAARSSSNASSTTW